MNQEERKNIDDAKNLTVQLDTQEEKETREINQSKILEGFYSLLVTLITVLISSSIMVFFDIYNKNNLASYKIFDAELKYSLDAVLKKILPSVIALIVLIVSGHFVCKVLEEVWEEWKRKREYRKNKKVCRRKNSDRVCETPPKKEKETIKKEKETIYEKRNANIERLLTAFPFFFAFPIVFFLYLFSISSIYLGAFGIIALDVFSIVIIWVMCSGTILLFLLWLLQYEEKQAYFWIWFILVPMEALILTQAFHINLKDFFSRNTLGILLAILAAEGIFLFFLKIFISLAQIVWASIEKRISGFLGRETGNLKTLRFLLEIVCCTFGMFILLLIMSQPASYRKYYPVVYENGANGNILGVAIYQDDTTLIVLPAEKTQEDGILYELTGDTNYMYVDKSGVVIEQVSKDDIDWKNHLNVGQDSNIT